MDFDVAMEEENNQALLSVTISVSVAFIGIRRIITPADEKTHGFNRVDDSPQIF